jgi:hypothetical protein
MKIDAIKNAGNIQSGPKCSSYTLRDLAAERAVAAFEEANLGQSSGSKRSRHHAGTAVANFSRDAFCAAALQRR